MRDRYGLTQSGRSNLNQDFQDFYVQSHDRIGFDHCRPHNKPVQPMIEKASQKSSMEETDRSAQGDVGRKEIPSLHFRYPISPLQNFAPDLKIDFAFPITALVGPNGTNKSFILRAIEGSLGNENLGVY